MKNNRGEATIIVIAALALVGLGAAAFSKNPSTGKPRAFFWARTPAAIAQNADAKVVDAKAEEQRLQDAIDEKTKALLGKVAESATAADQAAAATVAAVPPGAPGAREAVTTKTLTSQTVTQLTTATGVAVDPARIVELQAMVDGLNKGLSTANDALRAMTSGYDAELAARKALEAKLAAAEAKTHAAEEKAAAANAKAQAWGLERDAVASHYENLKRIAIALVVLIVALSIWLFGLGRTARAAKTLSADLVALVEHAKDEVAKVAPDKVDGLKASIKGWVGDDHAFAARVEKIKSEILRR